MICLWEINFHNQILIYQTIDETLDPIVGESWFFFGGDSLEDIGSLAIYCSNLEENVQILAFRESFWKHLGTLWVLLKTSG